MPSILDQIIRDTREALPRRKAEVPPGRLEAMPLFDRRPLPLAPALRQPELSILAEIKKASPSRGLIRPDFDVAAIARQYQRHGAAAISVLTEPRYFQGALPCLAEARREARVPLLRKDFIFDPYQVLEARAYGADAVLLIAAVLDAALLTDLQQAAADLGLSCLVEVYELHELDRIDFDRVDVLGVNNRDLHTFSVDVDHALRVFAHVPEALVKIAESGLKTARELAYLRAHGVDAVLMGETLMRADDPGLHLATLKRDVAALLRDGHPSLERSP